jgi:hypothetical protein
VPPATVLSAVLLPLLLVSLPAGAITLGGGGDPREVNLAETFDPAVDSATAAQTYMTTEGGGKFAKIKRVAILNFCTQFVYAKSAEGSSSGATRTYTASTDGGIPGGLDLERMQHVSDVFYDSVEAGLAAAGLEVVPWETLAANADFQKYAAGYASGPQNLSRSVGLGKKASADEALVAISAKDRPFSSDCRVEQPSATGRRVQLAHKLKDIYLLSVNAVVDFAKPVAKGGFFHGAAADLEYGEYLVPGETQFHFTGIPQPLYLRAWLKQALVPAQNPFAVGAAASEGLTMERSNALNHETTTITSGSSAEVRFDPQLYYDNAAANLQALTAMFLATLKSR